jgi:1-deoxyxylulose-5-phosphate synthase
MEYRRLGRTDLKVSEIGLGTVELGLEYGLAPEGTLRRPSRNDAARLLSQALDCGINYIDTARAYGDSEEIIGWALKSCRKEYVLASKVLCGGDENTGSGSLKTRIVSSVSQSLSALQTDVIDLMQLHSVSAKQIRRGEHAEILQDLQRAGSIRFIGATTYGEEAAMAALRDGRYDSIQIAYNVLDREPEIRVLPFAQSRDVGIVARSVLLKGALTNRYRYLPAGLEDLKTAVEEAEAIASIGSRSLPEFAYRFVLAQPAVSTALVGTASIDELKAALQYRTLGPLSVQVEAALRQVIVKDRSQLNPGNWPDVP